MSGETTDQTQIVDKTTINPTQGHLSSKIENLTKLTMGGFLVMTGIIAAIFLAAGALLSSYLAEKTATYLDLRDKINEQSNKIDSLVLKIQDLEKINTSNQQEKILQPVKSK